MLRKPESTSSGYIGVIIIAHSLALPFVCSHHTRPRQQIQSDTGRAHSELEAMLCSECLPQNDNGKLQRQSVSVAQGPKLAGAESE